MTKISSDLLNDTLSLVQLARETALARGNRTQAEKLAPVANNLRTIVSNTRQSAQQPTATSKPSATASGASVMGQSDFKTLLAATQATPRPAVQSISSTLERNQVISSMAAAGMSDLDIARQMGITRDDVRLVINLNRDGKVNPTTGR